jgi:hypothetical protein
VAELPLDHKEYQTSVTIPLEVVARDPDEAMEKAYSLLLNVLVERAPGRHLGTYTVQEKKPKPKGTDYSKLNLGRSR